MESGMDKVNLTIDGMACQAKKEATILEAAREMESRFPRSVIMKRWDPRAGAASAWWRSRGETGPAWSLPAFTRWKRVAGSNRDGKSYVNPENGFGAPSGTRPGLRSHPRLAPSLGVEKAPFQTGRRELEVYSLRLCVKTCEEAVGVSAIGLAYRGSDKKVGTPYAEPTGVCIGCGACHFICPTGPSR